MREVYTLLDLLSVVGGSAIAIKSFLTIAYDYIVWPTQQVNLSALFKDIGIDNDKTESHGDNEAYEKF